MQVMLHTLYTQVTHN